MWNRRLSTRLDVLEMCLKALAASLRSEMARVTLRTADPEQGDCTQRLGHAHFTHEANCSCDEYRFMSLGAEV